MFNAAGEIGNLLDELLRDYDDGNQIIGLLRERTRHNNSFYLRYFSYGLWITWSGLELSYNLPIFNQSADRYYCRLS